MKAFPIGLFIIIIILVGSFVCNFRNNPISDRVEEWGQSGDYFSMVINLCGTVVVSWLSYLVYKGQQNRDEWEKKILETQERPYLIFVARQGNGYNLMNVGKAAAHKVIVAKIPTGENQIEKPTYKAYSIPAGGHLDVYWSDAATKLYAKYEDMYGKNYLVCCYADENTLVEDPELLTEIISEARRKDTINIKFQ